MIVDNLEMARGESVLLGEPHEVLEDLFRAVDLGVLER